MLVILILLHVHKTKKAHKLEHELKLELAFINCINLSYLKLVFKTFKDVRANCFCASLLRTQIHMPRHATSCHAMYRARALSTKMNNDRADGHCCSFDWI